ncbi:MAG: hypothetical protein HZA34_00750 [Candidatus Pacebacteria bacterium]|nr:hypothetical protein [Candidatus Paceibacterota bacterium]
MRTKHLLANYLYDLSKITFTSFVVGGILNYTRGGTVFVVMGIICTFMAAIFGYYVSKNGKE